MRFMICIVMCGVLCTLAPSFGQEPVKEEHIPGSATLKIRVVFVGELPKLEPINSASDRVCANLAIPNETLIVGKEGALQNAALIWDEKKNAKFKAFDKDQKWRDRVVELKCKDCRFEPHILVMRAGQKIKQVIVDQTSHNANFHFFNNQAPGFLAPVGKPIVVSVPESEPAPIPIECNVHPWMKAHLIVKEHPYIGVSNSQGTIEIDNLPIGENVFRLWHEALLGPIDKVVVNGTEKAINRGRIAFSLNSGLNDLGTMELEGSQFKIDLDKK